MAGFGMSFCGGCVGNTGNKMCVAENCTKESHSKKADLTEITTSEDMVFIYTKDGSMIVHTTPSVPAYKFGVSLERYLQDRRSKLVWVAFFPQLEHTEALEGEEVEEMDSLAWKLDGELKSELQTGVTPMKKRPKLFAQSPALEDGIVIPLALVTDDLGPDTMVLAAVRSEWPKLVDNLDTLLNSL
jgi:hypothetical protein